MNDRKFQRKRTALSLPLGIPTGIAAGTLLCTLCALCFCLVGCTYCCTRENPVVLYLPLALISLYLSVWIGGHTAAFLSGHTWQAGLGCGIAVFLLLLILSLCVPTSEADGVHAVYIVLMQAAVIPLALISALLHQRSHRQKHRRYKHRR